MLTKHVDVTVGPDRTARLHVCCSENLHIVVNLDRQESALIMAALLLVTFEPKAYSREKIEDGAKMLLGDS